MKSSTLIYYALISRLFIFILQFIGSRFDFSTDAFKGISDPSTPLSSLFLGLTRWDSLQFLHIARHGYVYEHSLAFFPLFPTLVRATADLLPLPLLSSLLLSSFLLNTLFFLLSSLLIYHISVILTKDCKTATIASLLFDLNPSSIFFSSFYTESLFGLLSLLGIRLLLSPSPLIRSIATPVFAAGLLTRSNGILNIGYILFYEGLRLLGDRNHRLWTRSVLSQVFLIGSYLFKIFLSLLLILLTLHLYSTNQIKRFCTQSPLDLPQSILAFGHRENLTIVGSPVEWCNEKPLLSPPFYSYVQSKYWDVSLFGYWQFKKLPNFLLATPALFLTFYFTKRILQQSYHYGLDWLIDNHGSTLPFALHSVALAIPALFVYNVEVFTRIVFSSSPFLYLSLSSLLSLSSSSLSPFLSTLLHRRDVTFWILAYFLSYFTIGTLMHAAFLPFT